MMGNSGSPYCSTAAHLHFEVTDKNGVTRDPSGYLSAGGNLIWDNSPDSQFSLTGSWSWPMKDPRITQGYGFTWWARSGFYNGKPHTGIDMVGDHDKAIYAPKDGILYKGTASCRGAAMHYVAVEHDDVISWYWHVQ
jgi:murein DD-endopeptidase MepM/ murein hydrolase activator NlpD